MRSVATTADTGFASRFSKNPWLVTAAVAAALSLLSVMQQYMLGTLSGRPARWQDFVFYGVNWLTLGLLTPLPFYLGRRWPIAGLHRRPQIAIHTLGLVIFAVCWAIVGVLLGWMLHRFPYSTHEPITRLFVGWLVYTMPFSLIMYLGVLGCVYAFSYALEARDQAADAARLAAQLAESQLGALRMQLNPHFLFNSLNTVAVLIREQNRTSAARIVDLLAGVLRQVLRADRPQEVPLEEELHFLRQYLAIEEVRFSDRLKVQWLIEPEARSALVPDFLLQPLVENAVKHGIAKKAESGSITIAAQVLGSSLELSVSDDGRGMNVSTAKAGGVGLTNTKERLQALYGHAASVIIESSGSGTKVLLRIPFRRRQE